jgi:hypothetical protein
MLSSTKEFSMKKFLLPLLFSVVAQAQTTIIDAPVEHIYVPMGFDSNDSVEVVVTGYFPNACYSRNSVAVKVSGETINIDVTAIAPPPERSNKLFCADIAIPFKEVVSLGNLQGGDYIIRVNGGAPYPLKKKIQIAEARSNAVDDNIYAAIDWVENKGNGKFLLHGWKYSNCFALDEVKVLSNNDDTFSVLPVMKELGTFCPMKGMPVTYPVKLDFTKLKMKRPLIHVRTMDGKSVNAIVDLEG